MATRRRVLRNRMADRSFSIVFIIEAILKIVSLGFGVYLRNGWNKLDFFIVMSSIIDIIITYSVWRG